MKIKTTWELQKLFYPGFNSPKLARDMEQGERAVDAFVASYKEDTAWLSDPRALAKALAAHPKKPWVVLDEGLERLRPIFDAVGINTEHINVVNAIEDQYDRAADECEHV